MSCVSETGTWPAPLPATILRLENPGPDEMIVTCYRQLKRNQVPACESETRLPVGEAIPLLVSPYIQGRLYRFERALAPAPRRGLMRFAR